jgi:hypothetical protein
MSTAELALDHVVAGVPDLDAAAARLESAAGLTALAGGTHPWGTENRIVALGSCYLELIAVRDPLVAAGHDMGRWVAAMAEGRAPWGWAARTSDIDAVATRLGLGVAQGSRRTPDGELRWRLTGVPTDEGVSGLPFVIDWGDAVSLPGQRPVEHRAGRPRGLALHVGDDPRLRAWLGQVPAEVVLEPGPPGVHRLVVELAGGPVAVTRELLAG